ncbi:MAG: PA0069 family radical SAM protein [Proteobacteria bacterium]|nr:PA0069 family radical SAM protein [Pseudomonadota bacterium]
MSDQDDDNQMDTQNDPNLLRARKGRGSTSNHSGRFESEKRIAFDDGWGTVDEPAPRVDTQVTTERTSKILSRNQSPDIPFDRSINPYRGCEHGCIYCFARPTHAFLGLSPGLDFESKLVAKPEAPAALRAELNKTNYRCQTIALGANTDPYQPVERQLGITRAILETLRDYHHPVSIVTKSNLILRDLDILTDLAAKNLANVLISITSLDRTLARRMEPRAPTPGRRLDTVRQLRAGQVPVGVLASPMIPGLNDTELELILDAAAEAGALSANYILVRLPLEIKKLFAEWLDENYPERAKRVLNLIRETRNGALYQSEFTTRMRGTGTYAQLLAQRFDIAARRLGLNHPMPALDCTRFRNSRAGIRQLDLFGPQTDR